MHFISSNLGCVGYYATDYPHVYGCMLIMTCTGKLDIKDLQYILSAMWRSRNRWKFIGLALGIENDDIKCIHIRGREDPDECFRDMLSRWIETGHATWAGLAKALKDKTVGYEQLAETVERALRQKEGANTPFDTGYAGMEMSMEDQLELSESNEVSFKCPCGQCALESYLEKPCSEKQSLDYPYLNTQKLSEDDQEDLIAKLDSDAKTIKRDFADLCNDLSKSLKKRRKSARELVNVISSIDKTLHEELDTKMDIDSIFVRLHKRVSFFNYDTVEYIIERLGRKSDKEKLKWYIDRFCKRRVFEVKPGAYESSRETPERKKFIVLAFKELEADFTLESAKSVRRSIARLLKIRYSDLQLHRIDKGSIILVFSLPNSIAQDVFPLSQKAVCEMKDAGFVICISKSDSYSSSKIRKVRFYSTVRL